MKQQLLTKMLLVAAILLLGGTNSAWATDYPTTYDFNSWVTTNLTTLGEQTSLTITGENIATADAANVKVISDISTPAFTFGGRFATDDISNVYMRNGSSSNNQHKVNLGIQSKAANKHFSILNLKKGDVVTIVTGSGETSFVSTNATVGGVQVVSGNRVGSNVDGTETGATTVCTMTADGNLDLKLGSWAVIMSVTINNDTHQVKNGDTTTDGTVVDDVYGITMTWHGTWTYQNISNRGGDLAYGTYPTGSTNNLPNDNMYLIFTPTVTGQLQANVNIYANHGTWYLVDKDNGHVFSTRSSKSGNDYTSLKDFGTIVAGHTYYLYGLGCDWGYQFHSFKFTPKDNDITTYAVASGEIVEYGSEIDYVDGMNMTYGGAVDVVWTYDSGRGPGVHAGANATLTSGIPTAGTFVKFEPTSNGLLTLNWYAFALGSSITATLIDEDQTIKEVKTHAKGAGNASYTDDYATLLRPGVTYYLYLQGSSYNNTFKGFAFTKKTEVEAAIYDCKASDNSATFATAIDAESFATAAEVYTFNTNYHITNGALTDGVRDITGVIRNAAIADGTDWDGASIASGEKYAGAPDNNYLDKNTGTIDASQTIYGLPAGVYVLKAATRAKDGTSGTIYAWDGTNNHTTAINANGNTGGALDKGWDWTELEFTLTSSANVKVGFWANVDGYWASCDDWHLYKVESVSKTISVAGWSTFASSYALDLSSMAASTGTVKAYYASEATGSTVTLAETTATVPAGEGIMLKGTAGATITIPVAASGTSISGNLLKGQTTTGNVAASGTDGKYHYVFGFNTADPSIYGFYNLASDTSVPAGKAYLETTAALSAARVAIVFEDEEATGINAVNGEGSTVNGSFYDLQGRKIAQPTKGLYIVNGKKVIIK